MIFCRFPEKEKAFLKMKIKDARKNYNLNVFFSPSGDGEGGNLECVRIGFFNPYRLLEGVRNGTIKKEMGKANETKTERQFNE